MSTKLERQEKLKKAIDLYNSGEPLRKTSKALHIDEVVLKRELIALNLLRDKSENIRVGKGGYKINDDCLDLLTPEALYWIGFLYADGHIEKDRPRITITLQPSDKEHLEKYSAFFGEGLELKEYRGYFRCCFSSKRIYERLKELGFTHRKSEKLVPHDLLKSSVDFWRGVIDGDGWIYNTNRICIRICGTEETTKEFITFIKRSGIKTEANSHKDSRSNCWKLDLHDKKAEQVATLLYKGSTLHLGRKYNTYMGF